MLCRCACRSTSGGAAALATRLRAAFSTASPYRLALRPKVELPAPQHFISGSDAGNILSPWHQIPLFVPSDPAAASAASASPSAYMVATVARHSTHAQRLSLTLPFNPLVQERTAAGGERSFGLRTLAALGELPQTYDSAEAVDPLTGARGSGAPLAVVDIGRGPREVGTVGSVRVLGALPLIEGGVSAWKVRLQCAWHAPRAQGARAALTHPDTNRPPHAPLPLLRRCWQCRTATRWLQPWPASPRPARRPRCSS